MSAGTSSSKPDYRLKVTRYDQVSSLMLALTILLGGAVLLLFLYWLSVQVFGDQPVINVQLADLGDGNDQEAGGMELEGPIEEEIGQETDLPDPAIENTLATIADTVGKQAAMLDNPMLSEDATPGKGGGSRGDGRGVGDGTGDGRGTGVRRELRISSFKSLQTYAKQLDHFKIELGAILPGNRILYASEFSTGSPRRREGPADADKRYRFIRGGNDSSEAADRELLARAGISAADGRIIAVAKFLPRDTEIHMLTVEKLHAGSDHDRIRKVIFYFAESGSGYEFKVVPQSMKFR